MKRTMRSVMKRTMLLTAGLVAALAVPASAHETGVIRLDAKTLAVGAELGMRGQKFTKRIQLQIELRGTLKTFPLREVETDTAGKFQLRMALPADAKPGKYRVVAVASDGDDVGQAILVITAASTTALGSAPATASTAAPASTATPSANAAVARAAAKTMAGMPGGMGDHMMMPAGHEDHPSAENMKVDLGTSSAERLTVFSLIILSLAGGATLLVIARRSEG